MTQPPPPLPVYDPRHVAALHALADKLAELRIVSPTGVDLTRFTVPAADFNTMVFEHGLKTSTLHKSGRRCAILPLSTPVITCDFVVYETLTSAHRP